MGVREGYNRKGDCCTDCFILCCCTGCATTRLLIEVDKQGMVGMEHPDHLVPWHHGICDCCHSAGRCVYGFLCPQCANASAASEYDDSNWCFNCLLKHPCVTRSIIREGQYNIEGDCCGDMCVPFWCYCCSVVQHMNEVKHRGCVNNMEMGAATSKQAMGAQI